MTVLPIQKSAPGATATADTSDSSALLGVYRQPPITIVRGQGVELFDSEGRSYIDFTAGIGVNALGYGDAGLEEAMHEAMESGVLHTSNLYFTAPAGRLASELARLSSLEKVFFCNSGAEANEGAFKFARRWAREAGGAAKHEIIALRGAFHGRLFASLAATDRPQYRAPFRPLAGGVRVVERDARSLDRSLQPDTTAALIVEPVQGEGGIRVLDPAFLRELRELTAERNVALIFDEIQCGLGRTGWPFAHQRADVVPDMVTVAKPLAGGLPMGAILVSSEIAAAMRPGDHGTTFGGGPFVASVALHVLERLTDPALLGSVRETGAWLGAQLGAISNRTGRIRAVRGIGYMWGIDVMQPAGDVVARAREAGLLICGAGEHTLRVLPPLVAGREELSRGLAILEEVL
ncbi:MAG TPA: acetylornithine transaminase [Gemmatimonadaceae bacterium]